MTVRTLSGLALAALIPTLALAAAPALAGEKKPALGRAGKEVNSICFARSINNWREVRGENDVVLLERSVNDWYRVELVGACDARTLRMAQTIGIDSGPASGCLGRGDAIIVSEPGGFTRRCFIRRIFEWDPKAPAEDPQADEPGAEIDPN